ncbi:FAD/NAD-binding domain-containing protein [Obba rivulosa]|uniref:FAD/NAD-binding domain-containing protein n=1 Tax=Obba rivulosa TaxID=1052685 RepID=A0A8E2AKU8_9APHY|nr:FAD/NAD-binding domain-containing protein [Obba rivulosa]
MDARSSSRGPNGASDTSETLKFKLGEFSIDEYRPMRIVVIGAGFSGIIAGIRFRQKMKNINLTVYEQNAGIGGTWYSNKYPGLACDVPGPSYQLSFTTKTDWSSFYPSGPEICQYLLGVVEQYKLGPYIKLQHQLVHAQYEETSGKWLLRIKKTVSGPNGEHSQEFEDSADFLFTSAGLLSRWKWPDIEGLKDFDGQLFHSANFDVGNQTWQEAAKTWGDKRVAVIGVGSSALQIVPALQDKVAKLTNFVRGKTWLCPSFFSHKIAEFVDREPSSTNFVFTDEERERFKDTASFKLFRHELEAEFHTMHALTLKGSAVQKESRETFEKNMRDKLAKKPWIADHLVPNFGVTCRRITPGPGYLEALCEDHVDFVPTHIKQVTQTGIETVDGKHEEFDIIICATGYDTSGQFEFPMIGRGGVKLQDRWSPHPETYLSVTVDGFPNWFFSLGPNGVLGAGLLLPVMERQVGYAVQIAQKLQRERLKSIEVTPAAVRDFDEYLERFFPKTVYSEKCRSWYKNGKDEGRITGLWPGSALHAMRTLEHPRWEDYTYEPLDPVRNRFYWLGDGQTYAEKTMSGDRAWYLNDDEVDYPPIPED